MLDEATFLLHCMQVAKMGVTREHFLAAVNAMFVALQVAKKLPRV